MVRQWRAVKVAGFVWSLGSPVLIALLDFGDPWVPMLGVNERFSRVVTIAAAVARAAAGRWRERGLGVRLVADARPGAPVGAIECDYRRRRLVGSIAGADKGGDGSVGEFVVWAIAQRGHDAGLVPLGSDAGDEVGDRAEISLALVADSIIGHAPSPPRAMSNSTMHAYLS